jgi:hypothetical protein
MGEVMKTHIIQNMIIQDDRRVKQGCFIDKWVLRGEDYRASRNERSTPHNYSSPKSLIWIAVEPEPSEWVERMDLMGEGLYMGYGLRSGERNKGYTFQNWESPFSPNDLLVEPEEWSFDIQYSSKGRIGTKKYFIKSQSNFNCDWQPASTMPLSLASKCSKKYKVEQVVGIEERDAVEYFFTEIELTKKWHWLIIGEKI